MSDNAKAPLWFLIAGTIVVCIMMIWAGALKIRDFQFEAIARGYMEYCLGTSTPAWRGECPKPGETK